MTRIASLTALLILAILAIPACDDAPADDGQAAVQSPGDEAPATEAPAEPEPEPEPEPKNVAFEWPHDDAERPRLFAGTNWQCAIAVDGATACRGLNNSGELATGIEHRVASPALIDGDHRFRSIQIEAEYGMTALGLSTEGGLLYWGRSNFPRHIEEAPRATRGLSSNWTAIAGAPDNAYALRDDGTLWRVTVNEGDLSTARIDERDDWWHLRRLRTGACGLRGEGELYCWTANRHGEPSFHRVSEFEDFQKISVGYGGLCAIRGSGELWCWGPRGEDQEHFYDRDLHQLGDADDWRHHVHEVGHQCGIRGEGDLYCWGGNDHGQLGDGTTDERSTPTLVEPQGLWIDVVASSHGTCGMQADHSIWCWGLSPSGFTEEGSLASPTTPQRVDEFLSPPGYSPPDPSDHPGDAVDLALVRDSRELVLKQVTPEGVHQHRTISFPDTIVATAWREAPGLWVLTRRIDRTTVEAESIDDIPAPDPIAGALIVRRCDHTDTEGAFECRDTVDRLYSLARADLLTGEPRIVALPDATQWRPVSAGSIHSVENDPGEDCDGSFDPDEVPPVMRFIPEGAAQTNVELIATDDEVWVYRCLLHAAQSGDCREPDMFRLFPSPRRQTSAHPSGARRDHLGHHILAAQLPSTEEAPDVGPDRVTLSISEGRATCTDGSDAPVALTEENFVRDFFWLSLNEYGQDGAQNQFELAKPIYAIRRDSGYMALYRACEPSPIHERALTHFAAMPGHRGVFAFGDRRVQRNHEWSVFLLGQEVAQLRGDHLVFSPYPAMERAQDDEMTVAP